DRIRLLGGNRPVLSLPVSNLRAPRPDIIKRTITNPRYPTAVLEVTFRSRINLIRLIVFQRGYALLSMRYIAVEPAQTEAKCAGEREDDGQKKVCSNRFHECPPIMNPLALGGG